MFAGLTALTAQLTEYARTAAGLAGAVLAGSFLLRAIGDVGDGSVSWLSPIGWAQKTRPFAGERPWPLLLSIGIAALLVVAAVRLLDRRDLGAGVIAPRPGPAVASPWLAGAAGLARRLQRGGLLWWTVGIAVLGVGYGSITGNVDDFVGDNQTIRDVVARGGGSLVEEFLATSLLILSLVATGFAIQSVLRLRGEETAGRGEVVLAAGVGRPRWLGSHLAISLAGAAGAMLVGAVGLGLCAALTTGDAGLLGRTALAGLAYVPAIWVLAAIAVALFGVLPRWTALAWAPLAACVVIGMFGTLLDLPHAVADLSPFEQTPNVPAAPWQALPLVALTAIAVVITVLAVAGFGRRDVPA